MAANSLVINQSTVLPQLDFIAIAKTTRKTLDRLASFSRMRSSSEPNLLLTKISTKIISFIHLIDSSMLAAQMGYQLATDAMILCDLEEEGWESSVSLESMRELSVKGQEATRSVVDGFRDIKQQIYKIAASTKDNTMLVVVPPDPTHTETLKIPMKDIGTGLVANLNLLTEFSRAAEGTAEWWNLVKADLENTSPTLLPFEKGSSDASEKFSKWAELREGFQQYYNVVDSVHKRFPELLASSSIAWKAVASPRSEVPSSTGHSMVHVPLPGGEISSAARSQKPHDAKATSVFLGFFKKIKPKDLSAHEKIGISLHPPSTVSVRSNSNSQASTIFLSAEHVDAPKKPSHSKRALLSCCSGSFFDGAIAQLAPHGLMTR